MPLQESLSSEILREIPVPEALLFDSLKWIEQANNRLSTHRHIWRNTEAKSDKLCGVCKKPYPRGGKCCSPCPKCNRFHASSEQSPAPSCPECKRNKRCTATCSRQTYKPVKVGQIMAIQSIAEDMVTDEMSISQIMKSNKPASQLYHKYPSKC